MKLQESVKDREACVLQSVGWQSVRQDLVQTTVKQPQRSYESLLVYTFFFFTSGFFLHYLKIVSYIYSLETALPLTLIEASYWYPRLICLLPPNCIFSTNHQNHTLKHTIQCNILLFKNTRWLLSSYSNSYKFILSSCQQWLFIIFLCEDVHT